MTAAFTFEPSDRVRRIKPSPSVAAAARARELKAAGRDIVVHAVFAACTAVCAAIDISASLSEVPDGHGSPCRG